MDANRIGYGIPERVAPVRISRATNTVEHCGGRRSGGTALYAFDDAEVTVSSGTEDHQGRLISGAFVRRRRLLKTFEFRHYDPLLQTRFPRLNRVSRPDEQLSAASLCSRAASVP
jgi:hypothetical protein